MNKRRLNRFLTPLLVLAFSAIPLVVFASTAGPPNMDKWTGTWILNVQKSRYGNEKPPLGSALLRQVLKIRLADSMLDLYARMELADGTDIADETHLLDLTGKPHVTAFDGFKSVTETFKQLDGNTFEIILKARP